jgi:methyl-accepting chemotaxis protein
MTDLIKYLHWIPHLIIIPILSIAVWKFYTEFLQSGSRLGIQLIEATEELQKLKNSGSFLDLDAINTRVMINWSLRHCWAEYRDTLHAQKSANSMGMMEVSRWRSTAMANMFFTEQTVVDVPLKAEFYKHLPGILTGLGIIGTFAGLIMGLQGFQVSTDATKAQQSLQNLIGSVGSAFIVSGLAIALAMFVTWREKSTLNKRYGELENFCALIDGLFDAGAGEEYLQRLVEASETSATQAMQMKESLVTDLKHVLTELTQQQIATMTATSQQLGHAISSSLSEGLTEPLSRISDAVSTVGQNQGDAVNKMLTDVLGSFADKMEGMFGTQLRGMNEMMAETASTIRQTSERFEQLAAQIQQAGTGAADAMAQKMQAALENMQARQMEANEQMRQFVEQLKTRVATGQAEATEQTARMMKELGDTTKLLVEQLQSQAQLADQSHAQRQQERDEQMRQLMEGLKASMAESQNQTAGATSKLLEQLSNTTTQLLTSLQEQTHNADQTHLQRQQERDEQMRQLMEGLKASMAESQDQTAGATSKLLKQLGETTTELLASIQDQAHNADQTHLQRQNERDEQMRQLMEGLKASMAKSQSETAAATSTLLQELGATSGQLLSSIQEKTQQADQSHAARQEAMAKQVADLLETQQAQITRLVDTVQAASATMKESVAQLQSSTSSTVDRMGQGADRLNTAANALTTNLGQVKAATEGVGTNVDKLNSAASSLGATLTATQQMLQDQKSVRDALSAMVNDLRSTVENAKREAGLTQELVNGLKSASQKLVEAQQTADHYLAQVTDVMTRAHAEFAQQMKNTLREGNSAFHAELTQATGLLKGAIQDLGDVLDALPSAR